MWKPSQYAPEVLEAYREAQASHPSVSAIQPFCHATVPDQLGHARPRALREVCRLLDQQPLHGTRDGLVLVGGLARRLAQGPRLRKPCAAPHGRAFKRALDAADSAPPGVEDCPILIENAAGADGPVGHSFDEIQALIDATGGDERIGLCIDTQHLWASGVDYSSTHATNKLVKEIDMGIGMDRLRCLHLNDSKIELGGNRDRHANIGEGTIGTMGLAALVGHPDFRDLPLLLEVPGTGEGPRWEDVISARRVVVEGIKLYDGTVVPESCAYGLRLATGRNNATRKEEARKESRCKEDSGEVTREESGREENSSKESSGQEVTGEEVCREEARKESHRKEDSSEVTCEESGREENSSKESSGQEVTGEEVCREEARKESHCKEDSGDVTCEEKRPRGKLQQRKPPAKKSPVKKSVAKKPPKNATAKKTPAKKSSAKKIAKKK